MSSILEDERVVLDDQSTKEPKPCAFRESQGCQEKATHIGMCLLCGWSRYYCTTHAIWLASHRANAPVVLRCPGCRKAGTYPEHWAVDPL
jgi:hypothetical protein